MQLQRKITYRLYPNASHKARMNEVLALHCRTYNTLLEEHQYRFAAKEATFGFSAMCKEISRSRGLGGVVHIPMVIERKKGCDGTYSNQWVRSEIPPGCPTFSQGQLL